MVAGVTFSAGDGAADTAAASVGPSVPMGEDFDLQASSAFPGGRELDGLRLCLEALRACLPEGCTLTISAK